MKLWVAILVATVALFAIVASAYPATQAELDAEVARQLYTIGKAYQYMKAKRSPSIGLSLAEYMAAPQGNDQFHFIPSGRK